MISSDNILLATISNKGILQTSWEHSRPESQEALLTRRTESFQALPCVLEVGHKTNEESSPWVNWQPFICSICRLQMLENVILQKKQGANHCILTQADCQESHDLVTDGRKKKHLHTKSYTDKDRFWQISLPVFLTVPGTMQAVNWVSLCPWVRTIFAPALLSLFASLPLNPSCQAWLNWATVHLGCFPGSKENQVFRSYFMGWEGVKSNTKTNTAEPSGNEEPCRNVSWDRTKEKSFIMSGQLVLSLPWHEGFWVYRMQRSENSAAKPGE